MRYVVRSVDEAAALACKSALLPINIPGISRGAEGSIPNVGFQITPGELGTTEPPPRLDEHREEILEWLGLKK